MAILLRRDGQTVNAFDDAVDMSFAYNGQSGIIKGVYNEMSLDITMSGRVSVRSGKAVLQGRQFTIDTEEIITLQAVTGSATFYYVVFAEIDMASTEIINEKQLNGKVTLKHDYYNNEYPSVPLSQNLNQHPNGKAYLELYRFQQNSSGIIPESVERRARVIEVGGIWVLLDEKFATTNEMIFDNLDTNEKRIDFANRYKKLKFLVSRQGNLVGTPYVAHSGAAEIDRDIFLIGGTSGAFACTSIIQFTPSIYAEILIASNLVRVRIQGTSNVYDMRVKIYGFY